MINITKNRSFNYSFTKTAEYKRDIHERVKRARNEGWTLGKMQKNGFPHALLMSMLEGDRLTDEQWERIDKSLKRIGY